MNRGILIITVVAAIVAGVAHAQNCGCTSGLCCSSFGFCGTTIDYCGNGCRSGPCWTTPSTNSGDVAGIVTPEFFNGIIQQSNSNCAGRRFYTRGEFLLAAETFPRFGRTGSSTDSRREIAAYFAHVTHETGHFCYIEEINGASQNYCDAGRQAEWPCAAGKRYYGRGPLQLTWNYNYGAAGRALGFDGLLLPERVATDAVLSFRTSLWYWTNNVQRVLGQGFGATTRAINGAVECDGRRPALVRMRAQYYTQYCQQLGVTPGGSLTC